VRQHHRDGKGLEGDDGRGWSRVALALGLIAGLAGGAPPASAAAPGRVDDSPMVAAIWGQLQSAAEAGAPVTGPTTPGQTTPGQTTSAQTTSAQTTSAQVTAASDATPLTELWAELQLAAVEQLGRRDDDDPARAGRSYQRLAGRLAALATAAGSAADHQRLTAALQRLDAYWQGFQRVADLNGRRLRLNDDTLQPISYDTRSRLSRIKAGGGPAAAAAAGDAVISMVLVQQATDRFAGRGEASDLNHARQELEAIQHRLAELDRVSLEPELRTAAAESAALLGSYRSGLDQLAAVVTEETRLRAETIDHGGDELRLLLVALAAESGASSGASAAAESGAPGIADYQLPLIVTLVALLAPLLGVLLGWWIIYRRKLRATHRLGGEPLTAAAPLTADRPAVAEPALETPPPTAAPEPFTSAPEMLWPEAVGAALPAQPGPSIPPALVSADWLAGMGRMVALLNGGSDDELEALRQQSDEMRGELVEARNHAEARSRAMAGFLTDLGDLLSGPLATIVGLGDRLMTDLDRQGSPQLTPDVEMIQWTGEQMLRLIEALREIARIQAGTLEVKAEAFQVDHLVLELRERLRPWAGLFGNQLTIEVTPPVGVMRTDFAKLRTALIALLENACKFAEGGDVTLAVVRPEVNGAELNGPEHDGVPVIRFTVTDTGIGISPEQLPHIFNPFVGFGHGRTRGAGLGLALVRHYAERLGGTIAVESAPSRGSRFILTVPVELPAESGAALEAPVLSLTGATAAASGHQDGAGHAHLGRC
jgi:signal transduction histidine kinase